MIERGDFARYEQSGKADRRKRLNLKEQDSIRAPASVHGAAPHARISIVRSTGRATTTEIGARVLLSFLLLLPLHLVAAADDSRPSGTATSPISSARYEIVASNSLARLTFKLDRYTGKIWQLVDSDRGLLWESMLVEGISQYSKGNKPRFQLVLSGVVARITVLLDTVSGKSWLLVQKAADDDAPKEYLWQQMLEQ